jgi:hypothetical protein
LETGHLFGKEKDLFKFLPANTGYVEIGIAKWKAILEVTLGVFLAVLLIFWLSVLIIENPVGQVIQIYEWLPILLLSGFAAVCIYVGLNLLLFPEKAFLSLSYEKLTYRNFVIDWEEIESVSLARDRALTTVFIQPKADSSHKGFGIMPFYELSSSDLSHVLNTWKEHFTDP